MSYKTLCLLPVLLLLAGLPLLAQQGVAHIRQAIIEPTVNTASEQSLVITDYSGVSRIRAGVNSSSGEPLLNILGTDNASINLDGTLGVGMVRLLLDADTLVTFGISSGASDYGHLVLYSTPDVGTTDIGAGGLETRTIVLRNQAGFTAAIHLEETGGGTDTVQISGPASTAGVHFYVPGTDGTAGQCLSTNGSGVLSWAGCSGGVGSAAGAIGDVQISNNGAGTFGADAAFNWNNTDKRLKIGTSPPTTATLNVGGNIALSNNTSVQWKNSGGTPLILALFDSGNEFHLGPGFSNLSTGGGLYLYANGASGSPANLKLHWVASNSGAFAPVNADVMTLGSTSISGLSPFTDIFSYELNLRDPGGGSDRSEMSFWDDDNTGTFRILGPEDVSVGSVGVVLPDAPPDVGDTLLVSADLGSNIFQLAWGPGGGGTGCVPSGGVGEVQYSTGAGACADDASFVFDSDLELGVGTGSPNTRLHVVSAASSATNILRLQYRGNIGDSGALVIGNTTTNNTTRIISHVTSGSAAQLELEVLGANKLVAQSTGDILLPTNNTGIWFNSATATSIRELWMDSSNDFNIGVASQSLASGGDLVLWATGSAGITPIGIELDYTSAHAGTFAPVSGASVSLGSTTFAFDSAYINSQVQIDTSGGAPAEINIEDENGSGRHFFLWGAPGTMAATYGVRVPAAAPAIGNTLTVASLSGGYYNLNWAAGPSTSAPFVDTTAIVKGSADATKLLRFEVDAFTTATTRVLTPQNANYTIAGLETTETLTGPKTFTSSMVARSIIPQTDNIYALGSSGTLWGSVNTSFIGLGRVSPAVAGIIQIASTSGDTANIVGGSVTSNGDIQFTLNSSAAFYPFLSNSNDLGLSSRKWHRVYAGTAYVGPSGTDGATSTLSCGSGQAVKNITVSGGVVTSVSCGAP